MEDVGEEEFLVLLLVVKPELHQGRHLRTPGIGAVASKAARASSTAAR